MWGKYVTIYPSHLTRTQHSCLVLLPLLGLVLGDLELGLGGLGLWSSQACPYPQSDPWSAPPLQKAGTFCQWTEERERLM